MTSAPRDQNLDCTFCVSLHANALGKSTNPSLFSPYKRLGYLALIRQQISEKENSEFKIALLHLKKLTLCLTLSVAEGWDKYAHSLGVGKERDT